MSLTPHDCGEQVATTEARHATAVEGPQSVLARPDAALPAPPSSRPVPLSPEEILAFDAKVAAIHESAHAVICVVAGGRVARVEIRRTGAATDQDEVSTATGRCFYAELPADPAAVGLAGAAAESVLGWLADGRELAEVETDEVHGDVCAGQGVSETDRRFVGDADLGEAAWAAIDLVMDHWAAVEAVADQLIRRGTLSGDEVRTLVRRATRVEGGAAPV